jgi:hypothetical protein
MMIISRRQAASDLHRVHSGRVGRGEVQVDPGVGLEPGLDGWGLMGAPVLHDQVQFDVWVGAGDLTQEDQELFVPGAGPGSAT